LTTSVSAIAPLAVTTAGTGTTQAPVYLSSDLGEILVAGAAVLIPGSGIDGPAGLADPAGPVPFEPERVLGRKGLRYKDRATLLGSVVAQLALQEAAAAQVHPDRSTAVVVASCYGNLDTVCRVAQEIDSGGVPAISPMDLPNASSNVVAATIAIRNGFHGVCLSLCNGHGGGWDALLWGHRLIAAGRARSVLVVAVETPSKYEAGLRRDSAGRPLVDGAAAVLLSGTTPRPPSPTLAPESTPESTLQPEPESEPAAGPALLPGLELASVGGVLDLVHAVHQVRAGGLGVRTLPGRPGRSRWRVNAG
jgi:3-oxoacyl-[acyl-carrier-protein] synthase II